MKKSILIVLLSMMLFGLINIHTSSATTEVNMIVTSPAEDMSTQIHISWHTKLEGTFVQYTKASDPNYSNALTAVGVCRPTTFDTYTGVVHSFNQCQVALTGLDPNTEYIYRVGKTTMSDSYRFKTAGGEQFSFIHVTDMHVHNPIPTRAIITNNVINKLNQVGENVAFSLFSGDMVAYGSYYDQWESLFGISAAKALPFVMTPGNHCYYTGSAVAIDDRFFNTVTFNPQNGAPTSVNATYYFKYNNTLFISIDSEASTASNENLNYQREWFREVVQNNASEFIVVYAHRPFYTGDGRNASQAATMRLNWQTIFDECGVDLVLSGHNHVYARTHPVFANNITTQGNGTTYITGVQLGDRAQMEEGTPMSVVDKYYVGNLQAGSIISVEAGKMTLKFVDVQGTVLDTAEIYAKDKTINKTTFESSITLNRTTATPQQGSLSFANTGVASIKRITMRGQDDLVLADLHFPTNRTSVQISNIPMDVETYHTNVEILYSDGELTTVPLVISNVKYHFGTIDQLRFAKTGFAIPQLRWESALKNNRIDRLEVYVNGVLFETLAPTAKEVNLRNVNRYQENLVELRAIDVDGDRVFFERMVYGMDGYFTFLMKHTSSVVENMILLLKENR